MTSEIEKEINKIRLQIYEEIKDMTLQERSEYYRKKEEALIKEYGFKIYHSLDEIDRP